MNLQKKPPSIDENQIICSIISQVKSLGTEKNMLKEQLKAALQESNRTRDESKKISELNDRFVVEKTQLQGEKRLLEMEKGRMLEQFDLKWRKASEEKGLLETKLSKYDQISYDLLMLKVNNEKLRNENTLLQTERDTATNDKNMIDAMLHKSLQEKSQLESKLKTASESHVLKLKSIDQMKDELLMVKKNFEILQNEKKVSDDAKDKLWKISKAVLKQKKCLLIENEQLRIESFDLKLHEATKEKSQLESMLKRACECLQNQRQMKDELLKMKANFEKLQNEKKLLGEENEKLTENLKKVSKERDGLMDEKELILSQTETEKRHMRAEFKDNCDAVFRVVNQLTLSSNSDFERMTNTLNDLKNDILLFKTNFEKIQNEKNALDEANKKLRFELNKFEQDSLKLEKDHVKLQADFNMENSIAKIQIEAMKDRSSAIDAQNLQLSVENTKLEQQIDELKTTIEQNGISGLSSRIKALERECDNLKKEKDTYRARWKHVKSKLLLHKISSTEESD